MKTTLLVLSMLIVSGCATQTFNLDGGNEAQPAVETKHAFFVSGIGQKKEIDAAEVCGGADKVSKVETETDLLDNVLANVTFGIYTPMTARVYCKL